MNKNTVLLCGVLVAGFAESNPLTLEQALAQARASSPELRAMRLQLRSVEKGMDAAGRWINPRLLVEGEGLGWDNDLFSQGEYTAALLQEFQLGGKQKKDRSIAAQTIEAASQALQEIELQLNSTIHQAFIEVMVQQETSVVRSEQVQLARAFVDVAQRRYEAGSNSELDVVQAKVALGEALLLETCCLGDLQAAQETLASKIGLPMADLPVLEMPYYTLANLAGLSLADTYPGLQRLGADAERLRTIALLAKAQDTSNITLGAGYRYEALGDINTLVFSASMPLSFSKRGRAEHAAGILAADAMLANRDEFRRQLEQELNSLLALYKGTQARIDISKNNLIPTAQKAFEVSRKGYEMGQFSWLELISTQQNLGEIRIGYIGYLSDAHRIHAQLSKFITEGI